MHQDCSQVGKKDINQEKKEKPDPECTESASEGEEMEFLDSVESRPTPGQRFTEKDDIKNGTKEQIVDPQLASSSSQVGYSAMLPGSMKRDRGALQSGFEGDTIKVGIGSVVNSFWNKARKKKKDDPE